MKNNKYLYLITILYFVLGIINIHFALIGMICMIIPIILLFKNRKKTWCQGYCPRASLYSNSGKVTSKYSLKVPLSFVKGKIKWIVLAYFVLSLTIIIKSTIMVSLDKAIPVDYLKFLLIFPLEGIPQLLHFKVAPWLLHLSYRFYSLMMTTTILGLILSLVYKPRTWCTVCPIATISDVYIKGSKGN
ncbi:hypothetical protein [Anaerovorax odorimutans]|uniref:hypothetical protein n=1 Tax=Anaerovorax odorimutans TaxID=109327 RepID=UPI00041877F3|nr:hypothetical protein [Anaerovorax odorimutans]